MSHSVPDIVPALPEIVMAIGAMALLMLGVFRKGDALRFVAFAAVGLLAVLLVMVLAGASGPVTTFADMFVLDSFARFMKALILVGAAAAIVMSLGYLHHERLERFEYPVLVVLSTLGMMIMVSANDLISLYIGLEMQSLALYVLAAFHRDTLRSTEAGLKYFVLGALSSGLLLYGASLIYGFTGTTNFPAIAEAVTAQAATPIGLIFGIVFITAGLAFKISAVPFHMWTPDVYEGAPTPVTAFFAVAPKVAAMALFVRVMMAPFADLGDEWRQIIVFVSVASMILGAFAAIAQTNIKRLMAYSSIGHMGYALIGLAAGSPEGIRSIIIYMTIYMVMNLGTFAVILAMRREEGAEENIYELAGLARNRPGLALAMAIFMFSLAGIPPLAGFFAKFYVFIAAIHAELYALAVIGVVTSVVGTYYYVRIVKVMYFDEAAPEFDQPMGRGMGAILTVSAALTLLFFLMPGPLVTGAEAAAQALFP